MSVLLSEARKIFSLRGTWVYLGIIALGMASGPILNAAVYPAGEIGYSAFASSAQLAAIVMVFFAGMTIGGDHSNGTIAWSFLSTNKRSGVVFSQTAWIWLASLAAATLGILVAFLGGNALGANWEFGTLFDHTEGQLPYCYALWTFYTLAAIALSWFARSGVLAALVLVVEMAVIETAVALIRGKAGEVMTAVLPKWNLSNLCGAGALEHGPAASAAILLAILVVLFAGALLSARRRAVR